MEMLNQIETQWTMLHQSHADEPSTAQRAREQFLNRYEPAIRRYLLGALRDPDAADELYQQFVLKFLGGGIRSACPERGRLRSYLKTILFRMIVDHQRAQKRRAVCCCWDEHAAPAAPDERVVREKHATAKHRDLLLKRAWSALEELEQGTGSPFHTALRLRVEHPYLRSDELARALAARLQRPVSAANVRVILHRARDRFAELLLQQVQASLDQPSSGEQLEEELADLQLLSYCRPALQRHPKPIRSDAQ